MAVSKRIQPALTKYKLEMEELVLQKKMTKKTRTAKVSSLKADLEKEATEHFQKTFEGPLGKGLRVFRPEPQKVIKRDLFFLAKMLILINLTCQGGNSNTGVCANR